jgi:hypothetical protein
MNSRLKIYTILDDRQDQTKEKGTDIQFLVNKSLQIWPHTRDNIKFRNIVFKHWNWCSALQA